MLPLDQQQGRGYHLMPNPFTSPPSEPPLRSSSNSFDTEDGIELETLLSNSHTESDDSGERQGTSSPSLWKWTACAAVSLLSTKYLLVDLNVHYPFHLHHIQLSATAFLTIQQIIWSRMRSITSSDGMRITKRGWMALISATIFMTFSMMINMQAVLHFQNTVTIIMLSMVSYLIKLVLVDRTRYKWLKCLCLAASCAGILLGEYRLYPAGLMAALLGAVCAGFSAALYTFTADRYPTAISNPRISTLLYCGIGLIMTTITAYHWEWTPDFQRSLEFRFAPIFGINLFSTAWALTMGGSFLFPINLEENRRPSASSGSNALVALTLAGVAGCAISLTIRRSYMSLLQLLAFSMALLCIGGHDLFDTLINLGSNLQDRYTLFSSLSKQNSTAGDNDTPDSDNEDSSHRPQKVSLRYFILLNLTLSSLWVLYSALNFQDKLYVNTTKEIPHLDTNYIPSIDTEIVISMYREPIDLVAHLINTLHAMKSLSNARVHIYVKDKEADIDHIKHRTQADEITLLPNIGREGETYLNHILKKWDNLAKHTVFLQADVHNPREFYRRVEHFYNPERTGMLNLGWSGNMCNCNECGDRFGFSDPVLLLPSIHHRIYGNRTACDKVLLSYKGQFIASAARIRGIDKAIYYDLWQAFVDKNSWAHSKKFLNGRPDLLSAPVFGHVMERMWNLLLQYSSADIAWRCPTLLSGTRMGGSIKDCQCFDTII